MPLRRNTLATLAVAALGLGGLAAVAPVAQAAPDGSGLVISEVYGGGGNSGATWTNDFVELYNPTDAAISVDGYSVQYRSAAGSSAQVTELAGSVPAGGHYLIQQAEGAGGTTDLPGPDATGTSAMAGGSGQVLLLASTEPFTGSGDLAGSAELVDMVGYGSATSYETAPAPSLSNTTSGARTAGADSDANVADFTAGDPSPTNAAGEGAPTDPEEPAEPTELAIAEIQGTGAETEVAGDPVTTTGVVTAAYPAGGLFGFYLQTPGTGGTVDPATHTASDGLFVYQAASAGPVTVEPGDHVEVTGTAGEYAGATQVTVTAAADIVVREDAAAAPTPVVTAWPETDEAKEVLEGMLFATDDAFTVSNTYSTNQYGEVGLARGDGPLVQPTEIAAPGSAEAEEVAADNAARAIVLDDGSSWNYLDTERNGDRTPPYVSNESPVVVGAPVTLTEPVILTQGGSPSSPTYRFQPTVQATDDIATWPVDVANIRTAAPDATHLRSEGDPTLKVASFNVLNYFTTLGDPDDDNVSTDGCQPYEDRDGDGNNVRTGCAQRGAWDPEDLERQQEKIVAAINALDADVVGLMEIENSAALGEDTDEATSTLVAALNEAAGSQEWAVNPSSAELPDAAEQDVITNAIIYRPGAVDRVGEALALGDQSDEDQAFGNAREPIGQVFAAADGGEEFLFVVNHFKSKGSAGPWPGDEDTGDGQGSSNESRVRQATALRDWVAEVEVETGVDDVFLVGDFNAYTAEDPLQVLYEAGYADTESHFGNGEYSYSFSGLSGSLDHVLVNEGALERLTGTDIWNINSGESVAMEYSRFNYHATDFHTPGVHRSSDHDPVVVGLDARAEEPVVVRSTTRATVVPRRVVAQRTRAKVQVRVRAGGRPAEGRVVVRTGGRAYAATLNRAGRAMVRLRAYQRAGRATVRVRYLGTATTERSAKVLRVKVVKPRRR